MAEIRKGPESGRSDWTAGERVGERMTGRGKRTRRVLSASSLAGDRVRNTAGEDLGKIEEIMLDIPSGRIAYAVLSFGGFLGLGNKLFAIPWDAFTLDEAEKEFVLNVDRKVLEDAPGFDKDNWPDMADPDFGSQVYGHYGYKPYWDESDITETERERDRSLSGGGI